MHHYFDFSFVFSFIKFIAVNFQKHKSHWNGKYECNSNYVINTSHEEWQQYYRTIEILMIYFVCVSLYDEWQRFTKKFHICHTFMLKVIRSDKTKKLTTEDCFTVFLLLHLNGIKRNVSYYNNDAKQFTYFISCWKIIIIYNILWYQRKLCNLRYALLNHWFSQCQDVYLFIQFINIWNISFLMHSVNST